MENSKLSSTQLRKFLKHLCRVTQKYHEREVAKKDVDLHLEKIKRSLHSKDEIEILDKKIDSLLHHEAKVAELGTSRQMPISLRKKMEILKAHVTLLESERNRLKEENMEIRKILESVEELKFSKNSVQEEKQAVEDRIKAMEIRVDEKYKKFMIEDITSKIALLEESYFKISKDKGISPARLFLIARKLKKYKEELKKLKST